ncbi:MAG: dienelactone hydrolase family protein [Bryobacterales bacterium]|nr:dienelactone hydrolase family protein [Bryobacterales bacterium]
MSERLLCGRIAIVLAALAVAAGAVAVSAQPHAAAIEWPRVEFKALGGGLTLSGYLLRPEGSGQLRPAVVMLHGCSGLLDPRGRLFPLYPPWARALRDKGYVVLIVDSATPRGFGQTCSAGEARETMWRERPADAYAALLFLQAQPFVQADRIALMGWSQGGGTALIAINERTIGRVSGAGKAFMARLRHDFAAAVAFYPGACSEPLQALAYPPDEREGWTSRVPLLVLFGDADVWTELAPCAAFLDAAKARGNPIALKVYPGAVHAFDAPDLKRLELPQYRGANGRIPVLETDPAARADAFERVPAFLAAHLAP